MPWGSDSRGILEKGTTLNQRRLPGLRPPSTQALPIADIPILTRVFDDFVQNVHTTYSKKNRRFSATVDSALQHGCTMSSLLANEILTDILPVVHRA